RSPAPPKMTIDTGSAAIGSVSPTLSSSTSALAGDVSTDVSVTSVSLDAGKQCAGQRANQRGRRCRQMRVQCTPPRRVERREVAERLGELQRAERERLARNGHIHPRGRGDEYEDAGVRSAFVELSGRVQVAGTVAEHRRRSGAVPDLAPQRPQFGGE